MKALAIIAAVVVALVLVVAGAEYAVRRAPTNQELLLSIRDGTPRAEVVRRLGPLDTTAWRPKPECEGGLVYEIEPRSAVVRWYARKTQGLAGRSQAFIHFCFGADDRVSNTFWHLITY